MILKKQQGETSRDTVPLRGEGEAGSSALTQTEVRVVVPPPLHGQKITNTTFFC